MTTPAKIGSAPIVAIDDVGDVGAQDDEGRMRDVDDIEHAEGDRDADRHGRVKAAEQQASDDGVDSGGPTERPCCASPLKLADGRARDRLR